MCRDVQLGEEGSYPRNVWSAAASLATPTPQPTSQHGWTSTLNLSSDNIWRLQSAHFYSFLPLHWKVDMVPKILTILQSPHASTLILSTSHTITTISNIKTIFVCLIFKPECKWVLNLQAASGCRTPRRVCTNLLVPFLGYYSKN